ncbi:IclR family transcriptional regulator [Aestuariimicrobium sp. T2.26MG-19.2B]|uniref:IclR family transcriptional regulator n=1 Tax=Aestuariimicrobium sp. T2.26MG-19.2B TaxID=3040679 RepID=UPI00254083DA|nr:IclR family transcriptional regulator [Aestuariimicrobium sp. T2.26MG-19.2B]
MTDTTPADKQEKVVGAERVLAVLVLLAEQPDGVSLDDLATQLVSPKSTVHRALTTLRRVGFATTTGHGHYLLGDEYLRLAFQHQEARPDHLRVRPILTELASRFGETAHYAVLDGRSVVYRSKADPPRGGVRLTSAIGGRNPAHLTAVGKLLLAHQVTTREQLFRWVGAAPLEGRTPHSITDPLRLHEALEEVRDLGYATDDQENEVGINCVAVAAYLNSPTRPSGAVSVSGVVFRTPLSGLIARVDEIKQVIAGG